MADPAKKIRITFFWADEQAVVQDFNQKHSEKMAAWAAAFFRSYGFELDIVPAPGGAAHEAYQHCLARSGGPETDIRSAGELETAILAEKWPTAKEWLPLFQYLNKVEDEKTVEAKSAALDSLLAQIRALPQHHPDREELQVRFDVLLDEFLIFSKDLAAKRAEFKRLGEILDAINAKYAQQRHALDFDTPMRLALGNKVLSALGFSVAGLRTKANVAMASDFRLKIVHCRFNTAAAATSLEPRKNYLGATLREIGFNTLDGKFLWSGPYIVLNTNRHEDITMAHEIVHASGRGHLPPALKLKDLGAHLRSIKADPAGKLIVPPIIEYVDQGHLDGAPNDIINYQSIGKKPEDVILTDKDRDNLIDSDFVKPPPGSTPPP